MLACEDEEEEGDDKRVSKEQEVAEGSADAGFEEEVMDREAQHVKACGASGKEGSPPPAIVLAAQVEIAEEDAGFCTHHHKNYECEEHKAKHVVHLSRPVMGE